MEIGIFSKTYAGDIESAFQKMEAEGIYHTQFNLSSCGMEALPLQLDYQALEKAKQLVEKYKICLDALSGTFNMIADDKAELEDEIHRFEQVCAAADYLNIPVVSLCTGSKNPNSKWEWDNRNLDDSSWEDLIQTTKRILCFAEKYDLVFGVETEASNIINTPARARRYLDEIGSHRLKIIMDGANLFLLEQIKDMRQILESAFAVLGEDIVLAHAKDLSDITGLEFVAAGEGCLDFPLYIKLLNYVGYRGVLVMHGLSEAQISGSCQFLKEILQDA